MLTNNSNIPTWKIRYVLRWLKRKYGVEYRDKEIEIRQDMRKANCWRGDSRDKIWVEFGATFAPIAYKTTGGAIVNPSGDWEYLVVSLRHELEYHGTDITHENIEFYEFWALVKWREQFPLSRWMLFRVWLVSLRAKPYNANA